VGHGEPPSIAAREFVEDMQKHHGVQSAGHRDQEMKGGSQQPAGLEAGLDLIDERHGHMLSFYALHGHRKSGLGFVYCYCAILPIRTPRGAL
jgi:hypothetical protein